MTASQDTSAPGCASAESAPLPIRLHHAVQQQHALGSGIGPKLIDRRSPHASASRGMVTFVAETSRRDFVDSSLVPTHAQSRAGIESPRARVPYIAGCEFSPATVLRAAALQSKSKRFLTAYGARQLTVQRLAPPQPPGGIGAMSQRRPQPLRTYCLFRFSYTRATTTFCAGFFCQQPSISFKVDGDPIAQTPQFRAQLKQQWQVPQRSLNHQIPTRT